MKLKYAIFYMAISFLSCRTTPTLKNNNMASNEIFPKGQKINSENFTGTAWLNMLSVDENTYHAHVGNVTFEAGARTKWHIHPGGQILLVTDGVGYYQEIGKPKQIIKKGDTINCPPNISHWHGASANQSMTHLAIGTNTEKGNVIWQEKVSDEEYK